ncbi:MAG: hypothetical protein OEM02_04955 [Desulfobulbaceae bacterium]|nr:hypothetical protein [Desulfobulbaceae bacterium]
MQLINKIIFLKAWQRAWQIFLFVIISLLFPDDVCAHLPHVGCLKNALSLASSLTVAIYIFLNLPDKLNILINILISGISFIFCIIVLTIIAIISSM